MREVQLDVFIVSTCNIFDFFLFENALITQLQIFA